MITSIDGTDEKPLITTGDITWLVELEKRVSADCNATLTNAESVKILKLMLHLVGGLMIGAIRVNPVVAQQLRLPFGDDDDETIN